MPFSLLVVDRFRQGLRSFVVVVGWQVYRVGVQIAQRILRRNLLFASLSSVALGLDPRLGERCLPIDRIRPCL